MARNEYENLARGLIFCKEWNCLSEDSMVRRVMGYRNMRSESVLPEVLTTLDMIIVGLNKSDTSGFYPTQLRESGINFLPRVQSLVRSVGIALGEEPTDLHLARKRAVEGVDQFSHSGLFKPSVDVSLAPDAFDGIFLTVGYSYFLREILQDPSLSSLAVLAIWEIALRQYPTTRFTGQILPWIMDNQERLPLDIKEKLNVLPHRAGGSIGGTSNFAMTHEGNNVIIKPSGISDGGSSEKYKAGTLLLGASKLHKISYNDGLKVPLNDRTWSQLALGVSLPTPFRDSIPTPRRLQECLINGNSYTQYEVFRPNARITL